MFDEAVEQLMRPGSVGVLPTDTVYGIVARAADEQATRRLYNLKHREHKPGTVIAASIDQLVSLGIKRRYLTAVSQFWPGKVSVIVPVELGLDYLHQGQRSLAVRVVASSPLLQCLRITGPLITSSANSPGAETAATLAAAHTYFGDTVDFYVDGGDLSNQPPSTIIRMLDDAVELVRPGAVEIPQKLL